MPPLNSIINLRKTFQPTFTIYQNYYGVYNDIEYKFKTVLDSIADRLGYFNLNNIIESEKSRISKTPFNIKLCGDGTNIGIFFFVFI